MTRTKHFRRLAATGTIVLAAGWISLVPHAAQAAGPSMTLDVSAAVTSADGGVQTGGDDLSAELGDTIAYTFTITNTGDQDLNTFKVVADLLDADGIAILCPPVATDDGWLAPNGVLVCTAESEHTVSYADYGITGDPGTTDPGGSTDDPTDGPTDTTDDPTDDPTDTTDDPTDTTDDPTDDPTDGSTDDPCTEADPCGIPPVPTDCSTADDPAYCGIPLVLNATATAVARDGSPVTAAGSLTIQLVGLLVLAPQATGGAAGGGVGLPNTGA